MAIEYGIYDYKGEGDDPDSGQALVSTDVCLKWECSKWEDGIQLAPKLERRPPYNFRICPVCCGSYGSGN